MATLPRALGDLLTAVPAGTDRQLGCRRTRNALAYVPRARQAMVAAGLRRAFQQPDQAAARTALHHLGDQLHGRWPKPKGFVDDTSEDVLACLAFPLQHRAKLHSVNPLERLNKELKRRADVVGIRPNEEGIVRLMGAVLLEASDEWRLQQRYLQVEGMAELVQPPIEGHTRATPPQAA